MNFGDGCIIITLVNGGGGEHEAERVVEPPPDGHPFRSISTSTWPFVAARALRALHRRPPNQPLPPTHIAYVARTHSRNAWCVVGAFASDTSGQGTIDRALACWSPPSRRRDAHEERQCGRLGSPERLRRPPLPARGVGCGEPQLQLHDSDASLGSLPLCSA